MMKTKQIDEERAQSKARVVICWISLAGFLVVSHLKGLHGTEIMTRGLATILSYLVFSTAWYEMVRRNPDRWPRRRYVSLSADLTIMSIFFHLGGGEVTTYYPLFLWIIIGNGIRFGEKFLQRGILLGAIGFGSVLAVNPYWKSNMEVGMGLLLGVLVLPIFYQGALRRLRGMHELQVELARSRLAEQAKDRFLATMSHELRTPMNGVLGVAEALKKSPLDADQKNQLEIITGSVEALLHTINDILDYSRVATDELTIEKVAFDLRTAVGDVERLLLHSAVERGIDLQFEYPQDGPERVLGDPARTRQILFHLVGNAIKFTESGSVRITCHFPAAGSKVKIAVRDTGVGIPANRLDAIVAGFEQGDNSTTRKHGGAGLGLAITSRLAELMGGGLSVESKEGKGSTFTVTLDLPSVEVPEAERKLRAFADVDYGLRSLVVEDNKVNQFVIKKLLKMIGIEADVAANGARALEMLDQQRYDLVFMDIRMPVMNGYEATRHIRARTDDLKAVPIIAVTADATPNVEAKCRDAGMDAYLAKPLDLAKLHAAIEALPSVPKPMAGEPV